LGERNKLAVSEDDKEDKKELVTLPWWKRFAYTGFILAIGGWGFDYIQTQIEEYRADEDRKWEETHERLSEIRIQQSIIQQQQEAIWQATSDHNSSLTKVKEDQQFQAYVTAYQQRLIENAHSPKCGGHKDEKKDDKVVKTVDDVKKLSALDKMMKKLGGTTEEKKLIEEFEKRILIEEKIKELSSKPQKEIDEEKAKEQLKREYLQQQQRKNFEQLKELKK
jgi:hypothetical protein